MEDLIAYVKQDTVELDVIMVSKKSVDSHIHMGVPRGGLQEFLNPFFANKSFDRCLQGPK